MKKFEDIIKDRLDGYERVLPEGDLSEFRLKLDKAFDSDRKRNARIFAWLVPMAAAAGLALFFIPGHNREPAITMDAQTGQPVAEVCGLIEEDNVTMALVKEKRTRTVNAGQPDSFLAPSEAEYSETVAAMDTETVVPVDMENDSESTAAASAPSPLLPQYRYAGGGQVSRKVGRAAAGVLAGSSVAAFAGTVSSVQSPVSVPTIAQRPSGQGSDYCSGHSISSGIGTTDYHHTETPGLSSGDIPVIDERTGRDKHNVALRASVSLRVPLKGRWALTTGANYSLYTSKLGYTISSDKRQAVEYLGIPLRVDCCIARNKWLDVYAGAGVSADFCITASLDGQQIKRDGPGVSLIGAGGVQFNMTKVLGLFLDPSIAWNLPSDNRILDTYKSVHPLEFSVSGGIRVTLPVNK